MTNTETKKHDISISVAKGLLITLMVIGHSGAPSDVVGFLYLIHMPCFFFISGMLFKEKYLLDVRSYIKRKINGLYVPFVKWSLIFLLLHNLFAWLNIYSTHYTIGDAGTRLFKIFTLTGSEQLLGGFWFLKELLYASVITILFSKFVTTLGVKQNGRNLLLQSLFFVVLAYLVSIAPFKIPTIGSKTLLATAYFIAGSAFKKINAGEKRPLGVGILGYIAVIAVSLFFTANIDVTGHAIFTYFVISLIGSISTIYTAKHIWGGGMRVMNFIGKNTLNILTFHFLAFKIVSLAVIVAYGLPIERLAEFPVLAHNSSFLWILYTIAGVALPLLIGEGLEKIETLFKKYKKE